MCIYLYKNQVESLLGTREQALPLLQPPPAGGCFFFFFLLSSLTVNSNRKETIEHLEQKHVNLIRLSRSAAGMVYIYIERIYIIYIRICASDINNILIESMGTNSMLVLPSPRHLSCLHFLMDTNERPLNATPPLRTACVVFASCGRSWMVMSPAIGYPQPGQSACTRSSLETWKLLTSQVQPQHQRQHQPDSISLLNLSASLTLGAENALTTRCA